jgi:hypothetical protein
VNEFIKGAPARWAVGPARHPTPTKVTVPTCYVTRDATEPREALGEIVTRRMRDFVESFANETVHSVNLYIPQLLAPRAEEQLPWPRVWDAVSQHMQRLAEASTSVDKLEEVLQRLDRFSDLLEARLRVLLVSNRTTPPVAEAWIAEKLAGLQGLESSRACGYLLGALGNAMSLTPGMVEVDAARAGTIEVQIRHEVTWLVSPSTLPWPGIRARAFFPKGPGSTQLENKTFHLAKTLIDRTKLSLLDGSQAVP